jgi:hypothetical protein
VILSVMFAGLLAGAAGAEERELYVFGKANVNEASAEQLARVPGLRKADIERILEARAQGPIERLESLKLPPIAARFLAVKGETTFTVIRKLPIERLGTPSAATPKLAPNT